MYIFIKYHDNCNKLSKVDTIMKILNIYEIIKIKTNSMYL